MTRTAYGLVAVALFAATSAIAQAPSWTPPPDSARCPSKWGAGDQRGSGNHMKPQSVLNAAKLIKTGEVIDEPRAQCRDADLAHPTVRDVH